MFYGKTVGQTSHAASTSSNAEDCRLSRLTENSPDCEASESLDIASNPVLYHTNGNSEGHSEEEEDINASAEGAKTDNLTNNSKTKKLHEDVPLETKKDKHKILQQEPLKKKMRTDAGKGRQKKKRKTATT